jgi:hypothetical protein
MITQHWVGVLPSLLVGVLESGKGELNEWVGRGGERRGRQRDNL